MPTRYVILHHQLARGEYAREHSGEQPVQNPVEHRNEHWDLMLEQGDILLTWKLLKEPIDPGSLPIEALKIQDHRIAYLDYEGPISRDRGHVTRIDAGRCEILEQSSSLYVIQLNGDRFTGKFSLIREKNSESEMWIFFDYSIG